MNRDDDTILQEKDDNLQLNALHVIAAFSTRLRTSQPTCIPKPKLDLDMEGFGILALCSQR